MELYHLAEQYFHEHGDLLIPGDYVCYGKRLGRWIGTQRAAGKGKRGQLTESQIRRLEAIGMSWDPVEERWQAMYQLAKEYSQQLRDGYRSPPGTVHSPAEKML